MSELKPNEKRGKIALSLLWIILILNVIFFFIKLFNSIISELSHMGIYMPKVFLYIYSANHQAAYFIGYIYLVAIIISIITFIRWFRRAYFNLGILSNECQYNDSWASNGWFVPFMNLYVPYRIMLELYEKTNDYLLEKYISLENPEPYDKRLNTNHVKWWWRLSIIMFIIYCFQFFIMKINPEYGLEITNNAFYFLTRTGLLIILGIITISIIKNYQKAEELLLETKNKENLN